jgi:hypothetical protein
MSTSEPGTLGAAGAGWLGAGAGDGAGAADGTDVSTAGSPDRYAPPVSSTAFVSSTSLIVSQWSAGVVEFAVRKGGTFPGTCSSNSTWGDSLIVHAL